MAKVDIHNSKEKLESWLNKIKNSDRICEENKDAILRFRKHLILKGLSLPRIENIVYAMYRLALLFDKSFEKASKKDIEKVVEHIERNNWAWRTKAEFKVTLKMFFRWLRQTEDYPEEVRWIVVKKKNNHRLPEEILTEEEVRRLAGAAENLRDRAFVLTLYESGCRIGEFLPLKIKNVQFDQYGAVLLVNGKTGWRRVRIIASCPALSSWLQIHPFKDDPEAFVWIVIGTRNNHELMGYQAVVRMLRKLAKKAGVNKRVNPHSFRHARATHLASLLTEAQMKEHFGWVQASDMASVYVHLSGRDVDQALLKLHGLAKERPREETMRLQTCPRCGEANDPIAKFCLRCGSQLNIKILKELEKKRAEKDEIVAKVLEELAKDEKVAKLICETIERLKLENAFRNV
jgi:site-specific recombinase XerD